MGLIRRSRQAKITYPPAPSHLLLHVWIQCKVFAVRRRYPVTTYGNTSQIIVLRPTTPTTPSRENTGLIRQRWPLSANPPLMPSLTPSVPPFAVQLYLQLPSKSPSARFAIPVDGHECECKVEGVVHFGRGTARQRSSHTFYTCSQSRSLREYGPINPGL
ncbi:hypothetical protein EDC04DRAFT_1205896 [Pisolithus marmoratus]|nr:hypothetical protein EDC04DRAFT_1205896 [Pisolithus marmoratus]